LLKFRKNPFVRICGALFVRFLSPHDQLWERFLPFLMDESQISHTSDKSRDPITFGTFVEQILQEKNYFNIVLPRIPVLIHREIQKKLLEIPEKRQRKIDNQGKKFKKGMVIYGFSKKDA
jgi:hypothetical protein